MHIAMNNALAILSWHEFKFLGGDKRKGRNGAAFFPFIA